MQTEGKQPGSFVPPGILGFDASLGLPYDPAAARNELKASGYIPSPGHPLQLLCVNSLASLAVSQYVQQELQATLGLPIALQPLNPSQFAMQRSLKSSPLFLSSWIADYPEAPTTSSRSSPPTQATTTPAGPHKSYDGLLQSGREAQTPKARQDAYAAAQRQLLLEEAVIRPLYYDVNQQALVRPSVTGLEI